MPFISYAQNFEDVMLWRALKHIEEGFYIDIGAWSPDLDSVTRLFYEHNWHGINIEPNPEFHAHLEKRRPNDINLRNAISDTPGTLTMNFLSNPGLSTLDNKIALEHTAAGWDITKKKVEVLTLTDIWNEHVTNGQIVHFLKVDVEGLEKAVIDGNDWKQHRPWILVIEATLPMSQEESYTDWEKTLLSADYQFAYADGLNRFYVAAEHSELLSAFRYPPNVFDEFMLDAHQQANEQAQQANERAQQANERAQRAEEFSRQAKACEMQAEERTQQANKTADMANETLQNVYDSRSWRLTAPMRYLRNVAVAIKNKIFGERN